MSDAVKWGLLAAAIVVIIGLVIALPFTDFIDLGEFEVALSNVVSVAGTAFRFARGLINLFFLPFGRTVVTGLMYWLFAKWAIKVGINIVAWVYHFVFK